LGEFLEFVEFIGFLELFWRVIIMQLKKFVFVVWAVFCLLFSSSTVFACACCVERGFYNLATSRPDAHYLGLLENMKLSGPAEFYMTEAGFDGIKGLATLEKDDADGKSIALDVVEAFTNKT